MFDADPELTIYNLGLALIEKGSTVDEACDELEHILFFTREELRSRNDE